MMVEVGPACACVHALQLVHDLPEEAAGRRHERQDVTLKPGLSPCVYWPKRPTSSRETMTPAALKQSRSSELANWSCWRVYSDSRSESTASEGPAARVELKGLFAGDVVQLQADSLRFD